MTLHIQDDVSIVRKTGNLFLTNIHRVYAGSDTEPSSMMIILKIIFSVNVQLGKQTIQKLILA